MTTLLARPRHLWLVVVLIAVAACQATLVDGVTSLDFSGRRYYGAVIPLSIQTVDLTKIGTPERSNGLVQSQLEVFSLRDVDPATVLITASAPGDQTPYLVFVRDGVYPTASPRANLFQLVPQLCAFATPETDGCP